MAACAVALLSTTAIAAPAGGSWTGIYLGGSAGWAWGEADEFYPFGASGTALTIEADGGSLGLLAGYQQQWGNLVAGVEVSWSATNVEGEDTAGPAPVVSCRTGLVTCRVTDVDNLTTVGVRGGYAWEKWLFTVSGGYARADVSTDGVIVATGVASYGDTQTHSGWYLGAGAEYDIAPQWSLGVEYIHHDLGSERHGQAFGAGNFRDVDFDLDVIRARVAYRF